MSENKLIDELIISKLEPGKVTIWTFGDDC
jgi:hypothetical protein